MRGAPQYINLDDFGDKLKRLREAREMTQGELAEKVHVAPNSISYYEHGKSMPSLDLAVRLANVLKVSLDELLGRTEFSHFDHATVKDVAETLIKLSKIRGVKVQYDIHSHTGSIVFREGELAEFLMDYAQILGMLSRRRGPSQENRHRGDRGSVFVEGALKQLSDTPIAELRMEPDEIAELYLE